MFPDWPALSHITQLRKNLAKGVVGIRVWRCENRLCLGSSFAGGSFTSFTFIALFVEASWRQIPGSYLLTLLGIQSIQTILLGDILHHHLKLGLNLISWITDFSPCRSHCMRVKSVSSSVLSSAPGSPHGCHLIYLLFTQQSQIKFCWWYSYI